MMRGPSGSRDPPHFSFLLFVFFIKFFFIRFHWLFIFNVLMYDTINIKKDYYLLDIDLLKNF